MRARAILQVSSIFLFRGDERRGAGLALAFGPKKKTMRFCKTSRSPGRQAFLLRCERTSYQLLVMGAPMRQASSGRGRPPALSKEAREALILDATERLLSAKGISGASMDAIAADAGMSKRTLYEMFDSQAALFAACFRRIHARFAPPLKEEHRRLPLAERLKIVMLPVLVSDEEIRPLAILRAMVAEGYRRPELAEEFMREGPLATRRLVQTELDRDLKREDLILPDTWKAANWLCHLAFSGLLERMIDPNFELPNAEQAEADLAMAIDIFLRGLVKPKP